MFPVQVLSVLNHAPLFWPLFGLVFLIAGVKLSTDFALLAAARIFVAVGTISIPIVASGFRSAHAMSAAQWIDAGGLVWHQRAGS
jgi:hypothetical protein